MPDSRLLRILIGIAFLLGGLFAILPVLGLWMIPVGLLILSVDLPPIRRFRRRATSWYGRSATRRLFGRWFGGRGHAADKKKRPGG